MIIVSNLVSNTMAKPSIIKWNIDYIRARQNYSGNFQERLQNERITFIPEGDATLFVAW